MENFVLQIFILYCLINMVNDTKSSIRPDIRKGRISMFFREDSAAPKEGKKYQLSYFLYFTKL